MLFWKYLCFKIYLLTWFYFVATSFSPQRLFFFFIIGNHSFVVWKFFIFPTSQTYHLEKLDELILYTSKYPYSSSFFFLKELPSNCQTFPWSCLLFHFLCPFKFWQTVLHWSTVQYQIAESKCSQWDCWQKLLISFASLGALVLPVLSSPPVSQSGEAAAFYLILMKYSHFVRSPVLETLVYFAFCFITAKESIHMSCLFFFSVSFFVYIQPYVYEIFLVSTTELVEFAWCSVWWVDISKFASSFLIIPHSTLF